MSSAAATNSMLVGILFCRQMPRDAMALPQPVFFRCALSARLVIGPELQLGHRSSDSLRLIAILSQTPAFDLMVLNKKQKKVNNAMCSVQKMIGLGVGVGGLGGTTKRMGVTRQ
jgi:hypothetical protein